MTKMSVEQVKTMAVVAWCLCLDFEKQLTTDIIRCIVFFVQIIEK